MTTQIIGWTALFLCCASMVVSISETDHDSKWVSLATAALFLIAAAIALK